LPEAADAGADEQVGKHRTQRAAADHHSASIKDALLAFFTDTHEEDLAGVALAPGRVHVSGDMPGQHQVCLYLCCDQIIGELRLMSGCARLSGAHPLHIAFQTSLYYNYGAS
jgi:hypothetical protein